MPSASFRGGRRLGSPLSASTPPSLGHRPQARCASGRHTDQPTIFREKRSSAEAGQRKLRRCEGGSVRQPKPAGHGRAEVPFGEVRGRPGTRLEVDGSLSTAAHEAPDPRDPLSQVPRADRISPRGYAVPRALAGLANGSGVTAGRWPALPGVGAASRDADCLAQWPHGKPRFLRVQRTVDGPSIPCEAGGSGATLASCGITSPGAAFPPHAWASSSPPSLRWSFPGVCRAPACTVGTTAGVGSGRRTARRHDVLCHASRSVPDAWGHGQPSS